MRGGTSHSRRSLAARLYRAALGLYPSAFRQRYGAEALADFEALRRERLHRDGRWAAVRFTAWCLLRALRGAAAERTSGATLRSAPNTPRRSILSMRHDFRYARRSLMRRPGFALSVILLLATGIGATTAVFSVVDAVLLRDLPYPEADRLVYLTQGAHAPADFLDWQREVESVEAWAGVYGEYTDITGPERPDRVAIGRVTPDAFEVLGARSTLGRLFDSSEYSGDPGVVVVSHGLWRDRWGSDPELLGRQIRVGDRPLEVVGIMSPDFVPPEAVQVGARGISLWTPLDLRDPEIHDRGLHILDVIGRLAPGVPFETARAEMEVVNERFAARFPETHRNQDGSPSLTPMITLEEAEVGQVQTTLLMFLGAVGLLLLLACANVANLLLARGTDRVRELALRGALGATRRNVFVQLTVEALILSVAGGIVGLGIAFLGVRLFEVLEPGVIPRTESIAVDLRVLGFAGAVSVLTGLFFGIVPALQASRVDVHGALKEGTGRSTGARARTRIQGGLVVGEVALSLILLTGAGLLFHSFLRLTRVETGFNPTELVTVDLQLREPYDETSRTRFVDELTRRLRAIPQTRAVVAATTLPFQYASGGSCCWISSVSLPGAGEGEGVRTGLHPVRPGFLSALEVPLLEGRDLQPGDEELDPVPVVLGATAAERLFGEESPIGRGIAFSDVRATVVGVSSDMRHVAFDRGTTPELYLPWEARGPFFPYVNFGIRTDLELGAIAPAIRAAIWEIDPNLPIPDIVTMEGRMDRSVADERFYSAILAGFAAVALLLAAGGVYATFLYSVRQRVRELGIRLALGARKGDVVRLVLRRGFALTLIGIALGLAAAAIGARVLSSMVFGISPHDPLTYGAVSALMIAVALGACLLPALRAGRTDPLETLRAE